MGLCASLGEKVKMGPDGVREFHLSNKKEVAPEISHYIHTSMFARSAWALKNNVFEKNMLD